MIEARRELARAMGWTHGLGDYRIYSLGSSDKRKLLTPGWTNPEGRFYADYDRQEERILPNPFASVTHDYAVLEWMRETYIDIMGSAKEWKYFEAALLACRSQGCETSWTSYQIGDYARAACKVLEIALETA